MSARQHLDPTERSDYTAYRLRYLPAQLEAARRKVAALEREAIRYGMHELLTNVEHVNRAWDRETERAWLANGELGPCE